MLEGDAIKLIHDALLVTLKISAPILLTSMGVGLFISIIQTTTSIQEQTLTFVPKMVAVFMSIAVFMAFITHTTMDYTRDLFNLILKY